VFGKHILLTQPKEEPLEPFGLPIFNQIKHDTDNECLFIDEHSCVNINTQDIDYLIHL